MKQASWVIVPALCTAAVVAEAQSKNELALGSDTAKVGTDAEVPLTLSTTDQVQGVVAVFEWNAGAGTGSALVPGQAIAAADTIVSRVEGNYMVLGVVMDSDGQDAEIIAPGQNLLVATARIRCGSTPGSSAITFVDDKYASAEGSPLLENVVVVGGLSISEEDGLGLTDGRFECVTVQDRFHIAPGAGSGSGPGGRCGTARVLMDNSRPVEGYVVAICHDPAKLDLDTVTAGAAATTAAADFTQADVFATGGSLGVVIDLVAPFTNNTIPVGEGNHIASFNYCCVGPAVEQSVPLTFCDFQIGTPPKENVLVSGGESIGPDLDGGTFACRAGGVEICTDGIDNDGDGLIDGNDPDCQAVPGDQMFACGSREQNATGMPGPIQGSIGSAVEVCFFLKSPEDNAPGHAQRDHIQGFSMALSFCCDAVLAREAIDTTGTILEAIGAEFISVQVDNPSGPLSDQDPECELIIGVLVDALPPFDGQTIPPLPQFQRMGCVKFDIRDDPALCGDCCDIRFQDGAKGRGKVPIKNLVSVENKSVSPQLMNCEICIVDKERFYRGDCNMMPGMPMGAMSVDIADAAAVVSFLFMTGSWKFNPMCLDACDCNDDGRVDLADAVCILQYLFQFGRFPPAPGPGIDMNGAEAPDGPDPTDDKLDCEGGNQC
jgi:hypothetical protein